MARGGRVTTVPSVPSPRLIPVDFQGIESIRDHCDCDGVLVEGQLTMFDSPDRAIEISNRLST
jgi:hypothetical protein